MRFPNLVPRRSAASDAARRTFLLWLAGLGHLFAASASTSQTADRYVVLESQKFT